MLELLAKLFRQVRTYMLSERFKRNQVYGQFAGHTTMVFDREAEDIIIKGLTESGLGFKAGRSSLITSNPSPLSVNPLMIISSASRSNTIVVCPANCPYTWLRLKRSDSI